MQVLVLEDERPAGEKLIDLIGTQEPNVTLKWLRTGKEGMDYLTRHTPDLIFSDIELLDGNVFDFLKDAEFDSPIIFCTAYDRFFIQAFESNGIAYLLKPYTKDDFERAWTKYHRLFESKSQSTAELLYQVRKVLPQLGSYKTTFASKRRNGIFMVKTAEIHLFQAQGDFVYAFGQKYERHVINHSLSSVFESVDPYLFFQINRSELVNRVAVVKYEPHIKNRLRITLNGDVEVYTSNSRSAAFRSWIER